MITPKNDNLKMISLIGTTARSTRGPTHNGIILANSLDRVYNNNTAKNTKN